MELKDFIKGVISEITNAVKELQDEMHTDRANGSVVSPESPLSENKVKLEHQHVEISHVDFEVSVTTNTESGVNGYLKGGISVVSAAIGGRINKEEKENNGSVSIVRFSIPVIYPSVKIDEASYVVDNYRVH